MNNGKWMYTCAICGQEENGSNGLEEFKIVWDVIDVGKDFRLILKGIYGHKGDFIAIGHY